MLASLKKVLDQLEEVGAKDVPEEKELMDAPSGTTWKGKKKDGYSWEIRKPYQNNFRVTC